MRHSIAAPRCTNVVLREPKRLAGSHANLRLDQIDARHHLRHRVLDLNARIHLDEVEIARSDRQ